MERPEAEAPILGVAGMRNGVEGPPRVEAGLSHNHNSAVYFRGRRALINTESPPGSSSVNEG